MIRLKATEQFSSATCNLQCKYRYIPKTPFRKGWIDSLSLDHYAMPSPAGTTVSFKFWGSKDGADWGPEYTDIKKVPSWYRYLKVQATLSRNSLASAMPVLNSMTLTYKLPVQPVFF